MDISEVNILSLAYILNIVFSALIFFLILKTFPLFKNQNSEAESAEETTFTIAQYIGILSGIMGLLMIFTLINKEIRIDRLAFYIPFFLLFLIPYALVVIYWLSLMLCQKISDWYDEKQLQDIMKASLTTLLLSFPGLIVFLFIDIPDNLYFFLYYIYLVLILFSGSTLYFFKIKDIS